VTSATGADGIPRDGVPHVAFVGRSNVGKSSLLNALTKRDLARTSAAAGKTRLANLYRVEADGGPGGPGRWSVYFADLPGYGYARGGQDSVADLRDIPGWTPTRRRRAGCSRCRSRARSSPPKSTSFHAPNA
jgi:GTP-binding protein